MKEEMMKVRVTNAPNGWWTKGRVGEEFEVTEEDCDYMETGWETSEIAYQVRDSMDGELSYILKKDCEVVGVESETQGDAVEHPVHYQNGRFETIEMIEEITKGYSDGFVAHCVGTAVKYESRAPFKHASPLEDLKKSRQYLTFAIEHLERLAKGDE